MPNRLPGLKLRNIISQHLVVILIGVAIFYIDQIEFIDTFYPKIILLLFALSKGIYFLGHSFKKIEEASLSNATYNQFLMVILTNIFLIIISFTIDYTCLYLLENASFSGLIGEHSLLNNLYDFLYFSILTFTTTGFGDIVPMTKSAKALVTMEVVIGFITTIIVISNFIHIKDSIHDLKFLKIRKKDHKQGDKRERQEETEFELKD